MRWVSVGLGRRLSRGGFGVGEEGVERTGRSGMFVLEVSDEVTMLVVTSAPAPCRALCAEGGPVISSWRPGAIGRMLVLIVLTRV